jgi:hypothetical protein
MIKQRRATAALYILAGWPALAAASLAFGFSDGEGVSEKEGFSKEEGFSEEGGRGGAKPSFERLTLEPACGREPAKEDRSKPASDSGEEALSRLTLGLKSLSKSTWPPESGLLSKLSIIINTYL